MGILALLSFRDWAIVGLTVAFLATGVACKVQTGRLHAAEAKYQGFVAQTKAEGEAQAKLNQETVAKQKGATASVTKDYRSALTELMRLRDERARPGSVPATPNRASGANDAPVQLRLDCSIDRATEDALKLYYLQEFIRQQGLPVGQ